MISQAAIDAVTNPENCSSFGEPGGMRVLRSDDVVAELRRIEGISDSEARQQCRNAVAHIGGHVEPRVYRVGLAAGRMRTRQDENWWVPGSAVRP